MHLLLVSTYELGHQPLHLASAAAALRAAGHRTSTLDLSVERWDPGVLEGVDAVAFAVPMHTAMRIAIRGAEAVRRDRPEMPICFYGLYAAVARDRTRGLVDRVIAGEWEAGLVAWVDRRDRGSTTDLSRQRHRLPVRAGLPPLERYAHLAVGGDERLVGYVEASRGCAHRCRHCPVPVVYDGRSRRIPVEVVLDDVAQLAEAGARHITFGDPDFLNRITHAETVVRGFHERFPELTYDVTVKVEHILRHRHLVPLLADTGCLFVVTAVESLNDRILEILDKGHVASEAAEAVRLLRSHGIEPRPTWLPFTPWTGVEDVREILDFVAREDLVGNVDPVQYTIRLLIPEGSLLLGVPEIAPYLGPHDPDTLTYTWTAADARTDELQRSLAALVEEGQEAGRSVPELFDQVRAAVARAAGEDPPGAMPVGSIEGRPRLTEPWFC